jgi:hypothetical protein
LLTTVVTTPVAVFVAVTDTPGIKAPVASWTVPPTVAFSDCEKAHSDNTKHSTIDAAIDLLILDPREKRFPHIFL